MIYVLDTDTLIYFLKNHPQVCQRIADHNPEQLATTRINASELLYGAYNSNNVEATLRLQRRLLNALSILEYTAEAAEIYAKEKARLRYKGQLIADMDMLIASICLAGHHTLVSNNTKHFQRIEGLQLENWAIWIVDPLPHFNLIIKEFEDTHKIDAGQYKNLWMSYFSLYEYGDVCKHRAAVFYVFQAQANQNMSKKKPNKRMTLAQKVQHVLAQLSEQETKNYLQEKILSDKRHCDNFLIHYEHLLGETPNPDTYRKRVNAIIHEYSDGDFIDYYEMSGFCSELSELLEQATDPSGKTSEKTFVICNVILEAIGEVIDSCDDSNGALGDLFRDIIHLMIDYIDGEAAESAAKKRAISWSLDLWSKSEFSEYGYDAIDELFDFFCNVENPPKATLMQAIDRRIATAKTDSYTRKDALHRKHQLLLEWGDEEAAKQIVMDNLQSPSFRKLLINEKLEKEEFDAAISLIKEGIVIAEQHKEHSTLRNWQQQLLDIAIKRKQTDAILHHAEILLTNYFSLDYYRLLKKHSPDWDQQYSVIISKLRDQTHQLAEIYREENNAPALLELIEQTSAAYQKEQILKKNLNIIKQHSPEKALNMLSNLIKQYAHDASRSTYNRMADDLNLMKTIDGGEYQASMLIDQLLNTYSNRPSMRKILLERVLT